MNNIFEFEGLRPVIRESSFVHPQATVIGNVVIGENVYVGAGAVIRGDFGAVVIEDGCNVQETCVIHMFPGVQVTLHRDAHIGHGAVVHGAQIGRNALIGMGAVIMDNAVIGAECIVGALCFVPAEMKIEDRKVVVGNPAKIVKDATEEMIAWKTDGTKLYQTLPARCRSGLIACDPLREMPKDRPLQASGYAPWTRVKSE